MNLINFIINAKKSCYATNDVKEELRFEDGSKGFQIRSQDYTYIDRYYGFNHFCGSEKVFNSAGNLIWRMNYYGELSRNCNQPSEVYSFLREAMLKINEEYPFRGPRALNTNNLKYENIQNGTFDSFHGIEQIFDKEQRIYVLRYHGGMIK
ncbi:MAG: hypothetical protein KJ630_18610 [Proteobacteria bacterium]|nr:hypothetical protein [Pseudomonadota bacterium]